MLPTNLGFEVTRSTVTTPAAATPIRNSDEETPLKLQFRFSPSPHPNQVFWSNSTRLPSTLFYSTYEQQPKRLLWPQNYHLDMCGMTCDSRESHFYTAVTLRHANPSQFLTTASPSFCRHDLRSLHEQRKLCGTFSLVLKSDMPASSVFHLARLSISVRSGDCLLDGILVLTRQKNVCILLYGTSLMRYQTNVSWSHIALRWYSNLDELLV
ncbi:unnamed protein product [Rodentolepis nana]|uniref:Uncharacterized protein n=1 Tax=Rodentolepis nana TaxID=102285 RepID=A0A0R3TWK3_RODNA|nr:unnamed protein product [Rodentolepis nana]